MTTCFHCKKEHPEGHYDWVVLNKTALHGPWAGWRMAGRFLVAPDKDRITPEWLRGIMWREANSATLRMHSAKSRVAVVSSIAGGVQRHQFAGHGCMAEQVTVGFISRSDLHRAC